MKFRIGRKHLSKLYLVSIRPTLEYASIVWDGCSAHDIEKREKVQLSAARLVFLFLHLENPFIQKQVGNINRTEVIQQK